MNHSPHLGPRIFFLLWGAVVLIYLLFVRVPTNRAYLDFGDGNYQYISWRMTQGVSLYTDILSPQPPFHLWTGAVLVRLAERFGIEPLYLFRSLTHLIRIVTSATVGIAAWFLFRSNAKSFLAAAIFLILPEGYRWSQGYQSEHLELLFLCLGLVAGLHGRPWSRNFAPLFAVCAIWTNMSALPFSLLLIGLSVFRSEASWKPLLSAGLSLGGLLGVCLLLYGDAYLQNVWSNQVASIPTDPRSWFQSILTEGTTIIELEGPFILLALAGIWRLLRNRRGEPFADSPCVRFWVALWGIASVGSAIYVVKGGTVDYIFMLAEPALALFAADTLIRWFSADSPDEIRETKSSSPTRLLTRFGLGLCRVLLIAGVSVLLLWKPYLFITTYRAQAGTGIDLKDQSQGRLVEFSDVEVRTILKLIDHYCEPGDTLWAPPFFAALSHRPVAMDLSETYLWYVRWQHNRFQGREDPGVDSMIREMTHLLENRSLPLLLLNRRTGQWGHLIIPDGALRLPSPEGGSQVRLVRELDPRLERLQSALEEYYHPLLSGPGNDEKLFFQGWNEGIEVWVPKSRSQLPPPWVRVGFQG